MSWLQLKRGSDTAVAAYTPKAGEPVLDTTNFRLVFGDGTTLGGIPLKIATGTSGDNVPLLSGNNTWSGSQVFATATSIFRNSSGATGIEIGSLTTSANSYIDFHSSGTSADYDARIIATGGSSTAGSGTLTVNASSFVMPGAVTVSGSLTISGTAAIKGVTDGSSASSGYIGEYLTATASSVSVATGTVTNIASLTLTPGDWDVDGVISVYNSSAAISSLVSGLNTTSATNPAFPYVFQMSATFSSGFAQRAPTPTRRVSVSANTTVYLIANVVFSSGTTTCDGFIRARRMR